MSTNLEKFQQIMANRTSKERSITAAALADHIGCELQSVYGLVHKAKNELDMAIVQDGRPVKYWLDAAGEFPTSPAVSASKSKKKFKPDTVFNAYRTLVKEAARRGVKLQDVIDEQSEKERQRQKAAEKEERQKALSQIKSLAAKTGLSAEDLAKAMAG